jgi:signal transduction histidine kinase
VCAENPARRISTAATVAAVGGLVALTLLGTAWSESATLIWLDLVTAAASIALTPWISRHPVSGGLAASLLAALSPVGTPAASCATLWAARRGPFRQAVAVAIAGAAGQAVQGLWRPQPGLRYGWWLLLMTAAYAALLGWGTWAKARHSLMQALCERAERAEREQERRVAEARQSERTRIAREMHDVLAHRLSLLAAYAGAIEYRPDAPPERLTEAAAVIRGSAHQALDELREVITLLGRDDDADDEAPPGQGLADLPRLVDEARAAGQPVRMDDRLDPADPPPAVGRTAYRVVREALTNARKHAPEQPVTLTLAGGPGAELTIGVCNPTVAVASPVPGGGTGLVGLAERVALAGGGLQHEIGADGEFRLTARLPWPA